MFIQALSPKDKKKPAGLVTETARGGLGACVALLYSVLCCAVLHLLCWCSSAAGQAARG